MRIIAVTDDLDHIVKCENCIWFNSNIKDLSEDSVGKCTKHAPKDNYGSDFPWMAKHQWCGQFELMTGQKYNLIRSDFYKKRVADAEGKTKRQSSRGKAT